MRFLFQPSSSVTRWLLVVVGWAVFVTAQPAKAASSESPPAAPAAPVDSPTAATSADKASESARGSRTGDTLLIPGGSGSRPDMAAAAPAGSSSWIVVLGLCALGAGWFWWKRRAATPMGRGNRPRQIEIEESRPLGNRQYLVVASVGSKKFLLGIAPGSIQMLAPLEAQEEPAHATVR